MGENNNKNFVEGYISTRNHYGPFQGFLREKLLGRKYAPNLVEITRFQGYRLRQSVIFPVRNAEITHQRRFDLEQYRRMIEHSRMGNGPSYGKHRFLMFIRDYGRYLGTIALHRPDENAQLVTRNTNLTNLLIQAEQNDEFF